VDTVQYVKRIAALPPPWLGDAADSSVVVSSRIRLARNLAGRSFPDQMDAEQRYGLWSETCQIVSAVEMLDDPQFLHMPDMPEVQRNLLFERHLISREQLGRGRGSGIIGSFDESLSVMVNEEDHFRLQCFQPALNLVRAWESVDAFDSALGASLDFAFSKRFGYLTCCPSNVGTGMRASVMLHLPALSLLDEIRPVVNGLSKIGLAVRGMWGEGSDVAGHMYQVSNQITLGKVELEIVNHLGHIIRELMEHEENARNRLLQGHRYLIEDYVGRARGVLQYARILSSKEAFEMLSALRLGVSAGLVGDVGRESIDQLFLAIQPAHLQMHAGGEMDAVERGRLRARMVRQVLNFDREDMGIDDE
jgi:protein arginine kinase